MLSKKEKELRALKLFQKDHTEDFIIVDSNRECPDFLISQNGKRIGLEITDYDWDHGSSKGFRARESFLNELHEAIKNRLLSQYSKGFSLHISYKAKNNEKSNIKCEVDKLFALPIKPGILRNPTLNIDTVRIEQIENNSYAQLSIWKNYPRGLHKSLNDIIKSKSIKKKNWNLEFDSSWLVITSLSSFSSYYNINQVDSTKIDRLDWDRIFLFGYQNYIKEI